MAAFQNLEGQTFGKLLVLGVHNTVDGGTRWLCQCACGKQKVIWASSLKRGTANSCGCSRRGRAAWNRSHMESANGGRLSPEYSTWAAMIQRCTNKRSKSYKNWGGRGITICERWLRFENFLADMGRKPSPRHSIDRFPNKSGNYEPGNCRWATAKEQANNMRSNRILQYDGEALTLMQWAERVGLKYSTLGMRLHKGWSIEQALTTHVRGG